MTHRYAALTVSLVFTVAFARCAPQGHEHEHAHTDEHAHAAPHEHTDEHAHAAPHEHTDEHTDEHTHAEEHDAASQAFTAWTDRYELFAEATHLEAGHESEWIIHVTQVDGFAPLADAAVELQLTDTEGQRHVAQAPLHRPGIYRASLVVPAAAPVVAAVAIGGTAYPLGTFTLPPPAGDDAQHAAEITFLKEEQWLVPFAVTAVQERAVQSQIRALGWVAAAPGSETRLHAPASGTIRTPGARRWVPGDRVEAGMVLATVTPLPEVRDDAELAAAVERATAALEYAEAEVARLAPLVAAGVVGGARLAAAELEVTTAQASLRAAERQAAALARAAAGDGGGRELAIVAPIGGALAEVNLLDGARVAADASLAVISNVDEAVVDAHVPEAEIPNLTSVTHAVVHITGFAEPIEVTLAAPLSVVGPVDPTTHTVEVRVPLPPVAHRIVPGQSARVWLGYGEDANALVVPRGAISDEDGRSVVYVQRSGEAFERRPVRTGRRVGEWIEVVAGLAAREHVVSEGAWLVRLASGSTAMPSHGHAH